jgi:mRNA-degrading endonuclease toxin of MazEF toxin-antitoxin module
MCDLVFVSFVQLRAEREVTGLKWPFYPEHAISGVILVDQVRSVSWEKRYVKMAGVAPVKLLDEVRERLAVLLQID